MALDSWRAQLDCNFPQVLAVLDHCMVEAQALLSPDGINAYLEAGRGLGKIGRGPEPVLAFLQAWPQVAQCVGEDALDEVMATVRSINKSPNGRAIAPFLQSLPGVARRLPTLPSLRGYLALCLHTMEATSGSIHGIHKTYASPSWPDFLAQAANLLQMVPLAGLRQWADYGIRNYGHHPDQQRAYFSLQSADSKAVLQRERHGTLLVDNLRSLELYLRALWQDEAMLVPYATAADAAGQPPYFDSLGMRLPDVQDARAGVSGLDRYRVTLAHMAAHRLWSQAIIADNYSPMQRLAIECFEDARMDQLTLRRYPGVRHALEALHPTPTEGACNPQTHSCFRHRLAMLSRALLCRTHAYTDAKLITFVARFHDVLANGPSSTADMAALALAFVAKTRLQSDQLPSTYFDDTEVDYRDDNRHLWRFHELSDDEDFFETQRPPVAHDEIKALPSRHYPEWDYSSKTYRPEWVSLYEGLHPAGAAAHIDQLLEKHSDLARQLKRMLDGLKPQNRVRQRYQEDGPELDLDIAVRSLIDMRAGCQPDTRVTQSHQTNGRSIAVTLLLDLSESLNSTVPGGQQTVLELSQEAVAILGWAVEQLGDPFAIAGFNSNTRSEVRYQHIKGFDEHWDDGVKARLAAMGAAYSTRMGAAMRHAAHTLGAQKSDKKLLLVLTDGQPHDVDVHDAQLLIEDARQATRELEGQGIFAYCISLDRNADAYVGRIFGHHHAVIDQIAQLPEKLPQIFMALTR
jgi:nitric oxide reductase NorD protein